MASHKGNKQAMFTCKNSHQTSVYVCLKNGINKQQETTQAHIRHN